MMKPSRWERLAPLTGVVFVVIVVVAFSIGGSTPEEDDPATKVQAFYVAHHDKQSALALLVAISIPFLLFFSSTLRQYLRRMGGTGQLANAAFAGGILAAVGFGLLSSVHLAVANAGEHATTISAIPTLNVLDNNDFIPAAAGAAVLVFSAGLAVVRHGGLPKWLGWVGIVIGVVGFTPAGFFALLAAGLWILIASILLTMAMREVPVTATP
jgi:hypothetical protein